MSAPFLASGPGREQLDQFDRVVQQRFAVSRKPLPVAIRAVDGHRTERGAELHQRRHVDDRLLRREPGLPVRPRPLQLVDQRRVDVLEVPVDRNRGLVDVHSVSSRFSEGRRRVPTIDSIRYRAPPTCSKCHSAGRLTSTRTWFSEARHAVPLGVDIFSPRLDPTTQLAPDTGCPDRNVTELRVCGQDPRDDCTNGYTSHRSYERLIASAADLRLPLMASSFPC